MLQYRLRGSRQPVLYVIWSVVKERLCDHHRAACDSDGNATTAATTAAVAAATVHLA